MENFHLRWIPNQFTESLQHVRVETCWELLQILETKRKVNFKDL
jgi:hypothetical protein